MTSQTIIATRESRLALWQAEHVRELLQTRFGHAVELLGMTTRGDQILDRALSKVGGKGLFVKELETALEEGRAHLAVHSLKDVPMDLPPGFVLAAVLEREDPRDAFVSNRYADLAALPQGAKVGTSSLRRVVQLLAERPDLAIEPLRGNLDTRLRKLDEGQYDAIVLAAAGLKRLGLASRIRALFDVDRMIPAAGQGALGIEVREDAAELRTTLAQTVHRSTWLAVHAERAVSRALGGSCSMPLAAHAVWEGGTLRLTAALGDAVQLTRPLLRTTVQGMPGDEAAARVLGERAAAQLKEAGAVAYLQAPPASPAEALNLRAIVTRPREQALPAVQALRAAGIDAVALPLIEIAALEDAAPLIAAWAHLDEHALVMFVSANAVQHFFAARPSAAAAATRREAPSPSPPAAWPAGTRAGSTGPGTSAALRAAGVPEAHIAEPAPGAPFDSESLWAVLRGDAWAGRSALIVRGEDGRDWLSDTLREAGVRVSLLAAYRRTLPRLSAAEQALLAAAQDAPARHLWLFSSSEAVSNLRVLAARADWSEARAAASHARIAAAARDAGFGHVDLIDARAEVQAGWIASLESSAP